MDLALDGRRIQPTAYNTIRWRLLDAGYHEKSPDITNIFEREVERTGLTITVKLDLITGEHDGPVTVRSHQHIHGMNVSKLRGTDLALDHTIDVLISGELPDGGEKQVRARVAAIPAFVCMKAIAMTERKKPKDAYDILFCLRHYRNGPGDLARALMDIRDSPLVRDAIASLRKHFESERAVGPVWAGQVASEHGENEAITRRDAYERMQLLLRQLSSLPY